MRIPNPDDLEPIERASRDELQALQLKRIRWTLRHAYQSVPHYRKAFDAAGVHPNDLNDLTDIALFPFTVKDDFRRNYPFQMFAVPREKVVRIHASSGTTGKPTVVGYTQADVDAWAHLVARSIRASGGRTGDIVLVSYGYGLFTGGLGAHYGAERLGCTVIPMSGGQTERQVQLISDLHPSIIMVTPSYLLAIADEFVRQGLDPGKSSLEIGILGAEPWTEAMRWEIESRLNISALNIYGLSEVMGPGIASECIESKDGLVIWEDHFYPEIVNPDTGEVLPDGQSGELVLTSLTREALPMVRYRTRDITCLLPPTARSMRRMARISGRTDDMLIIRGVNVFPSQIEELVLNEPEFAPHYQLVLTREKQLDVIEVRAETRSMLDPEKCAALGQKLRDRIKGWIGISSKTTVVQPGTIERATIGKAKRVIDRRSQSN
jgi:phenylacetate-CoA ligase